MQKRIRKHFIRLAVSIRLPILARQIRALQTTYRSALHRDCNGSMSHVEGISCVTIIYCHETFPFLFVPKLQCALLEYSLSSAVVIYNYQRVPTFWTH